MTGADRPRFMQLMEMLGAAFRAEVSEALLESYWLGLDDVGLDAVQSACRKALSTCEHMPRPVELRRLTGEVSAESRAVVAWNAVRAAIRSHGAYKSVDFDDPAVNAAIRSVGGWQELCGLDRDEIEKWRRPKFERAYAAFLEMGRIPNDEGRYLVGIHESGNRPLGHPVLPPSRIATGLPPLPFAHALPANAPAAQALPEMRDAVMVLANGKR